jgi:hypothetical protein
MQTNEQTKDRMIRQAGRTRGKASPREVLGNPSTPSTESTPSTPSTETPFHKAAATAPAHQPEHHE